MPRLPAAEREAIQANTRQQLLAAAAAEFAREGYGGANVNRISQAAGLAKGTIYNYFPSKRALLLALIDAIAAAHVEAVRPPVEAEAEPARRLECFFRSGFAFVEQHPAWARVIVHAIYGPDDEFRQRVYRAYEGLFALLIQDVLGAGVAQGVFRPVDPDLAATLLMTVYLGSCSQLDDDGRIWLDPGQVAAFVLDGLGRRDQPASPGA